jgi:hypothetical protein
MGADDQMTPRRKPTVTITQVDPAVADRRPCGTPVKPTPAGLGVDLATLDWQRSGTDAGSFEVAFVAASRGEGQGGSAAEGGNADADWVLLRVTGDPTDRVLVYDRTEWMCFIDGAGHGEFDLAPESMRPPTAPPRPASGDPSPDVS